MLNAVLYCRVSSAEQVSNFSLEGQEKACRDFASKNGFNVVKVFREEGASAKTVDGRPQLQELLAFCTNKKNDVDAVIVYKIDRWSRNTEKGLMIISLLAKYGVNVMSVTEPSGRDPMSIAMVQMMLVFAELDNNVKAERTVSNMKTALENGHWVWKAPIGYEHAIINNKNSMILLGGYKPIMAELFNEAATGIYIKKEL